MELNFNSINTPDGTGTAYHSDAHEFTRIFLVGFVIYCIVCPSSNQMMQSYPILLQIFFGMHVAIISRHHDLF